MTRTTPEAPDPPPRSCCPTAGVLAWVFPGLGHLYLRERRRGLLVMLGILFLFFTGLLVGGLDAVDRQNDGIWFLAQAFNGPVAFVADWMNQILIQQRPEEERLMMVGLGHVNAIGTLFIALGGLMNLAVILDALCPPARPNHPSRRSQDA